MHCNCFKLIVSMAGAIDFMIISFYILRESMEARVRTWAEGGPSSGTVMTRGAL